MKLVISLVGVSTIAVSPYVPSDGERTTYDPRELLYRSDLPAKSIRGVHSTSLNAVWDTVAPQIIKLLKALKIRYSAMSADRFITHDEDKKDTPGPMVIWIATHPNTTTAENAHDASLGILALLKDHGVEGVVIEWFEGTVERY